MRLGDTSFSVILLSVFTWQPAESFVRMNSTLGRRRRFFSVAARAVSASTSSRNTLLGQVPFVAEARSPTNYEYFSRQHARLFGVSSSFIPTMDNTEEETSSVDTSKYTDYEKWVRRLYMTNLFHPVKMGLTNMNQLHEIMGKPMDDPNRIIVHIAGTNGKGSVALKIANSLQNCGLKVGIFCSPHVSSFRERMQINGQMISEDEVVELLPKVYEMCIEHDIPATFFEITTALAFMFYAKRGAQVVVLETGLGGRLDATNVVSRPALSVITSIGLEHTRILGDTIEAIAEEKAGIMKPGCPVLIGPHCPQEVMQQCAKEKGAGPYNVPQDILNDTNDMLITDYDEENQRISMAALLLLKKNHPDLLKELSKESAADGVLIRPPCRFECFQTEGTTVILDVAHNPPAMEYLVNKLKSTHPEDSFRFVVGMSSDKDLSQCGRSLLDAVDPSCIHLVEAAHPRAAKLEAILKAEQLLENSNYDLDNRSITNQVLKAIELAKEKGQILVVCGSVFLMAEAREALGIIEPRDSDYIAEMAGAGVRHGQENFGNTTMNDMKKT